MIVEKSCIAIKPFTTICKAKIKVPGSKSISNRALILSVMCGGKVKLSGLLESEDVDLMRIALQKLGVQIEKKEKNYIITGTNGKILNKKCDINVGNAGTIARFLTCLLAAQRDGEYDMDGTEAMRKRPMTELLDCLEDLGSKIIYINKKGSFPFKLNPCGINNYIIDIDAQKSGQNISGILMQCNSELNNYLIRYNNGTVSLPFIKMTLEMMHQFSFEEKLQYSLTSNQIELKNCGYKNENFTYSIEPDATAASYFLMLPLVVGGWCKIRELKKDMLQGDIAFCHILRQIGAEIKFDSEGVTSFAKGTLIGGSFDFVDISDTFLTLAAISPLLQGDLEIFGIEHTRKQETDRVSAMARELIKLGQDVTEEPDRLIVRPDLNKLKEASHSGVVIDTYKDHRFAMSFAILGSYDLFENGKPWLEINDPNCCAKTFPEFFSRLDKAYYDSNV